MDRRNRNLWLHHLQSQSADQAFPQFFRLFLRLKRPNSVRETNLEAFVSLAVFRGRGQFVSPIGSLPLHFAVATRNTGSFNLLHLAKRLSFRPACPLP